MGLLIFRVVNYMNLIWLHFSSQCFIICTHFPHHKHPSL